MCGKSDGQLLCCEMCPASYHLKCLDPPLDKVPRGDWHCPDCTELLHMNDIEKFLKFEERRPDPGGEAAGGRTAEQGAFFGEEEEPAEGCPQYYVKWKEESYIHCEWVKVSTVERAFKLFPGLKVRARRFHEGLRDAGEGEDSDGAEAVPADWTTVDRVLAYEEGEEGGVEDSWYLVKWKGLGYDQASWEWGSKMQEVDGFKAAKKEYLWRESAPLAEDHEWVRAHGGPIYLAPGEARCRVCKAFEDDHLDRILKGAKKGKRSADKARYRCKATVRALDKAVEYEKYEESPAFLGGRGRELKLFEYQLEGLNWLRFAWKNRRHVILGDEMGLGKTIMTIAYFKSLLEEGHAQHPHLLIVPLSTLGNWERELDLWAPDLYYVTFAGNAKSRDTMKCYELGLSVGNKPQTTRPKFNVLLTTYENVLAESSTMQKFTWACVVVDEGHRLKNKESRLFKALQPLEAFQRVLLTGTPLQNNLDELFMLMHFLDQGEFSDLEEFQEEFANIGKEDQISKLHDMLKPHLLRRLKKDVLKQLPPKKEQIIRVELSLLQKKIYRDIILNNYNTLQSYSRAGAKAAVPSKNILMELRKCCNHPFMFEPKFDVRGRETGQKAFRKLLNVSGKLQLMDKMVAKLIERDHRIIIFSQFTTMLDILEEWLGGRSITYERVDGGVRGSERQLSINRFNESKESKVFLLSTKAGGLGINLATADTVIIFDSDFNPHNDIQAQARAHRMGQSKEVMIYRFVSRATVEEAMVQRSKSKLVLEHLVVRKAGTGELNQKELDDVLRYGAAELFAREEEDEKALAAEEEAAKGGEAPAELKRNLSGGVQEQKTLTTLAGAEMEAGRWGGGKGRGIVYDDAAIEKILDRKLAWEEKEQEAAEEGQDEQYLKAFKVANFEMKETAASEEEEGEEEAGAGEPGAAAGPKDQFWEGLLKDKHDERVAAQLAVEEEAAAKLGKGKRERKKINYKQSPERQKKGKRGAKGADGEYQQPADLSPDSGSDPGLVAEPGLGDAKKRRVHGPQANGAVAHVPHPLMSGGDTPDTMLVKGFTKGHRKVFLKLLMKHGPGKKMEGTSNFDFLTVHSHMQAYKTLPEVQDYGQMMLQHLKEYEMEEAKAKAEAPVPYKQPERYRDGVPVEGVQATVVLIRIAEIHLVLRKVEDYCRNPRPYEYFVGTPKFRMPGKKYWMDLDDHNFLLGVVKHGYGAWREMLEDNQLNLKSKILAEVIDEGLEVRYEPKPGAGAGQQQNSIVFRDAAERKAAEDRIFKWCDRHLKNLAHCLVQEYIPAQQEPPKAEPPKPPPIQLPAQPTAQPPAHGALALSNAKISAGAMLNPMPQVQADMRQFLIPRQAPTLQVGLPLQAGMGGFPVLPNAAGQFVPMQPGMVQPSPALVRQQIEANLRAGTSVLGGSSQAPINLVDD